MHRIKDNKESTWINRFFGEERQLDVKRLKHALLGIGFVLGHFIMMYVISNAIFSRSQDVWGVTILGGILVLLGYVLLFILVGSVLDYLYPKVDKWK